MPKNHLVFIVGTDGNRKGCYDVTSSEYTKLGSGIININGVRYPMEETVVKLTGLQKAALKLQPGESLSELRSCPYPGCQGNAEASPPCGLCYE